MQQAAPREPSALTAISCGARPTMPTQTTIMNSASGRTMPLDHPSALHTGRRLASAKQTVAPRITEKPGEIAREKRADDDQEGEDNRAVRCHAAEVLAGASMAMNSRGVAR